VKKLVPVFAAANRPSVYVLLVITAVFALALLNRGEPLLCKVVPPQGRVDFGVTPGISWLLNCPPPE